MDTELVALVISTDDIQISPSGSVVGPIWLRARDVGFPEQNWSDFSVALIGAWLPNLQTLRSRGGSAECYFMEGPYHFTVSTPEVGRWSVACFEDREALVRGDRSRVELVTTPEYFLASATSAGRTLLAYCDTRGWWNDDTERLRRALEKVVT